MRPSGCWLTQRGQRWEEGVCCAGGRSSIKRRAFVLPTATSTNRMTMASVAVFVWPELTLYHLNHITPYPAQPGRKKMRQLAFSKLLGLMLLAEARVQQAVVHTVY